jgi:hypothetical protein
VYTSVFDCDQKSQVALLSSDNMGIEAIEWFILTPELGGTSCDIGYTNKYGFHNNGFDATYDTFYFYQFPDTIDLTIIPTSINITPSYSESFNSWLQNCYFSSSLPEN